MSLSERDRKSSGAVAGGFDVSTSLDFLKGGPVDAWRGKLAFLTMPFDGKAGHSFAGVPDGCSAGSAVGCEGCTGSAEQATAPVLLSSVSPDRGNCAEGCEVLVSPSSCLC
mmetsp:Transcript_61035/g.142788  ORF Transcript_61035/g.142788 Transcript_61035/m.142788 type:complete len:111 (-) Transcript_61035:28-360(-)